MRLKRNCSTYQRDLYEIFNAVVNYQGYKRCLQRISFMEVQSMIHADNALCGIPQYIAINSGTILFYPIPDKAYSVNIVGTDIKLI